MKVLFRDRITGVSTTQDPLSTYGPGNMLDDSNRNQWVSSSHSDTITVSCNNQVDSFFVGRTKADSATYSFFARPLSNVTSLTASGKVATVVTSTAHDLYTGDRIRITGSNQAALNVDDVPILRINDTKFQFYAASAGSGSLTSSGHSIRNYERDVNYSVQEDTSFNTIDIASIPASSTGLVTITTASNHNFVRSDTIFVAASGLTDYDNVEFRVLAVPSATTFITESSSSQTVSATGTVNKDTTSFDTSSQFLPSSSITLSNVQVSSGSSTVSVTSNNHGFSTGDRIRVLATQKNELNVDGALVTKVDDNNFEYALTANATANISLTPSTAITVADITTFKKYDGTFVLNNTSFAVRFFSDLSSFVQGQFINAVSAYTTLPYNDDTSELEIVMSSTVDRSANIATNFLVDTYETESSVNASAVTIDATNVTYGPQAILKFGSSQGWKAGDVVLVSGITGTTGLNGAFPLSARNNIVGGYSSQGVSSGGTNNYWYSTNVTGTPGGTAAVSRVTGIKGRFIRAPYTTVTAIGWNSTTGVGTLTFSANHGLVNNDKIIIKGTGIMNLDGTYLVTYSTATVATFTIGERTTSTISSITAASGGSATVTTSAAHNLSVGDKVYIDGSHADHDQESIIISTPTVSSFTIAETSSNTSSSGTVYGGVIDTSSLSTTNTSISYSSSNHIIARPVNIPEFKQIIVGSLVEFVQNDDMAYFPQVTKIIGDGTSENDITLNCLETSSSDREPEADAIATTNFPTGVNTHAAFTSVRFPVTAGILRAGFSLEFPNAQIGLSQKITDYSVKKELSTGSYYFLNRDSAREFSGKITDNASVIDNFTQFAQEFLGEPFAALVLQDMDLDEKTALYAYFPSMPTVNFSNKTDSIRELSFSLKEVL